LPRYKFDRHEAFYIRNLKVPKDVWAELGSSSFEIKGHGHFNEKSAAGCLHNNIALAQWITMLWTLMKKGYRFGEDFNIEYGPG